MQDLFRAARFLLVDLASTVLFLASFLLTHNTVLSVALGTTFGAVQIATQLFRRKPVQTMEWLSVLLIIAAGAATILTNDPRIVLFKPSVVYSVVGVVMLRAGWMNRYLPAVPKMVAPDVAVGVGYIFAALMFATAAVNALVAITCDTQTWFVVMLIFGVASKVAAFIGGFLAIRLTTVGRIRAMDPAQRGALLSQQERVS